MATFRLHWDEPAPRAVTDSVLTLGNFDGVHRGHAALLRKAQELATSLGTQVVAITFDPHPLQLLRPDRFEPVLTSTLDRAALLQAAGAQHALVVGIDPAFLELRAREFFERVLLANMKARGFVEGPNFAFGRGREGDVAMLAALCQERGLPCEIVAPLVQDGVMVSSSRIRHALMAGDVRSAREGLGRPYRLKGTVVAGQRRGAGLGFPTANLANVATLVPGDGVYAARAWVGDSSWPAAVNVGGNPTFAEPVQKIEAHLVGFAGDLYGENVSLDFLDRLRETRYFASTSELLAQLHLDVERASQIAGAA